MFNSNRSVFQDNDNERKNYSLRQQRPAADNLSQAEVLLKDLFLDVDRAKRLKHPQANEIELE